MFRKWRELCVAAAFAWKFKSGILHEIFPENYGSSKMRDINNRGALTLL